MAGCREATQLYMSQLSLWASIFTSAKCWGWMGDLLSSLQHTKSGHLKEYVVIRSVSTATGCSFRDMGTAQKCIILYFCIKRGVNFALVLNHGMLLLLLSHFSRVQLCAIQQTAAHQAPPSLGFSRQEHWSGLPFPSPWHESEKWKWSRSVVSDP